VGRYEEYDEFRGVLPRKGRQASSREAEVRESDTLWPSGLKASFSVSDETRVTLAAGSGPVCGKSEWWAQSGPILEDPPRYEESSTAGLVRQDDAQGSGVPRNRAQRTTTLSETQVETTRLFGIPVLKRTLCSTRSNCEPGSHGGADPTLGVDYAELTDGKRST
jgi:hypothetical protein